MVAVSVVTALSEKSDTSRSIKPNISLYVNNKSMRCLRSSRLLNGRQPLFRQPQFRQSQSTAGRVGSVHDFLAGSGSLAGWIETVHMCWN